MNKGKFNRLLRKIKYSRSAVTELYQHYYPLIVIHIHRCFRGKLDGRDVAHQFFIKLLNINVDEFINYPTSWVYKIAEYIAIDMLRKDNKRNTAESRSAVEDKVFIEEDTKEILSCLSGMAREIVYLYYWEGYTLKEIADLLKINYSTVKYKHKNAKSLLKNNISKEKKNENKKE